VLRSSSLPSALMNFVAHPELVPPAAAQRMVSSYGRATAYEATSLAMRSSRLTGAEAITVPVTVAWGERDRLVRPALLPAPLARSLVLTDCGHVPMWDAPDLVADVLLEGSSRSV